MIEITETEMVYRIVRINRKEAIRILTEEDSEAQETAESLANDSEKELGQRLLEAAQDGGEVWDYLQSEVVENDSGSEWTVEIRKG